MYLDLSVPQVAVIITGHLDQLSVSPSGKSQKENKQKDKEERMSLVLWRRPVTTLHYFLLETLIKLKEWTLK